MATAATIINEALVSLGVVNELSPTDPFLEDKFFKALLRLLSRWESVGIDLTITTPTAPADELGNDPNSDDALITSLAIAGQKIAKVAASTALRKDQKIYYRQMKAFYGVQPEQAFPHSMPLGQGVNLGPRSRRFFPTQEET